MIIPTWKKIGQSSHLLAKKIGSITAKETENETDSKATHTGTLDPMAEGVIVVLTGADRFKKGKFSEWKKTYEFEIIFGVSTDSLDLLGLQTEIVNNFSDNTLQKINNLLPTFLGKQEQAQPQFSSQRIAGKSGFDLAKKQQLFDVKINDIEIFSLTILDNYSLKIKELEKIITNKISKIDGDFRQKEILNNWQETFTKLEKNQVTTLPVVKIKAIVSKRTYIRSLVRDLAKKLNLPATTFSIVRTQEGPYTKNDCHSFK